MSRDELQGWFQIATLTKQCTWCKYKVTEHNLAACEYGQPWFPHATRCVRYEPEDVEE